MLPLLAVPDPEDAALVFDALNNAYVTETDAERRSRLALLLIAARNDMRVTTETD